MAHGVPVQYFQSTIGVLLAISGALLFRIRFFDNNSDPRESEVDPRLRLGMVVVCVATLFVSLEAMREGWGPLAAGLVTTGVAVSLLPILLWILPPLRRDLTTQKRHPYFWVTVLGLILYCAVVTIIVMI